MSSSSAVRLIIFAICLIHAASYAYNVKFTSTWLKNNRNAVAYKNSNRRMTTTMMSDAPKPTPTPSPIADFSKYKIGQEYDGTLLSAKAFGIFVNIGNNVNVLIPRSQISKGNFEKLKSKVDGTDKAVKIELINVSEENQTLSGKLVLQNVKRSDLSSLDPKELATKTFTATVVGAHDFGIFAEIEELGVEGLVPASKLPRLADGMTIQTTYPSGTSVVVKIDTIDAESKKLTLNMKVGSNRADISEFGGSAGSPKWLQGAVQSISNFGLFVRPAGSDSQGLVHMSRIPRDLIAALKKISPVPENGKTDIENLFTVGDIVKFRIHSTDADTRRMELSMLPFANKAEDEDDYVVEGRDTEDEEQENEYQKDEDDEPKYNAEDTLIWWRGKPYVKQSNADTAKEVDEDLVVLSESASVVEGSWRRMFEMDLREDEVDFSSKAAEADLKEIEEEIGELGGLDDLDLVGSGYGIGATFNSQRFGSFVSFSALPAGWKEEMEFFKELETSSSMNTADLKGGKNKENEELASILNEVEVELQQLASKQRAFKKVEATASVGDDAEAPPAAAPASPVA